MTDKEFRRLSREELVQMLCLLRENETRLKEENAALRAQLEDRRTRLEEAGSIADAVLSLGHITESVQRAADDYLAEIAEKKCEADRQLEEAKAEGERIVTSALRRAAEIISEAARTVTTDELVDDDAKAADQSSSPESNEHAEES